MNINNLEVIEKCKRDIDYMGKILIDNESFIWYIVEKYMGGVDNVIYFNSLDRDDLKQVGFIGMIKAIRDFSPAHDAQFTTYAALKIRGEIGNYLRSKGKLIRVTREIHELRTKIANLEKQKGFLTDNELSRELKCSKKDIEELRVSENMFFYLDEVYEYKDNEFSCKDWIIDDKANIEEICNIRIDFNKFTKSLKKLHRDILILNLKGYNQRKIGDTLNIAQSYVSRELIKIKEKFIRYVK